MKKFLCFALIVLMAAVSSITFGSNTKVEYGKDVGFCITNNTINAVQAVSTDIDLAAIDSKIINRDVGGYCYNSYTFAIKQTIQGVITPLKTYTQTRFFILNTSTLPKTYSKVILFGCKCHRNCEYKTITKYSNSTKALGNRSFFFTKNFPFYRARYSTNLLGNHTVRTNIKRKTQHYLHRVLFTPLSSRSCHSNRASIFSNLCNGYANINYLFFINKFILTKYYIYLKRIRTLLRHFYI